MVGIARQEQGGPHSAASSTRRHASFARLGYEASRIEAIAAEAEVSIGTIYNYYQNKGDLLVAIVSMEVNEVLIAGQRVVDAPPRQCRARREQAHGHLCRALAASI